MSRCWKLPSTLRLCAVGAGEDRGRGQVDDDPGQGDGEDQAAVDAGRVDQPAHALDRDDRRQHQQGDPVRLGGEDLDPFEAEGHAALGRAAGEPDRDQREADRGGVGEHVGGVGEQRQRVGDDPGHHLGRHEAEDQREGDRQLAAVGVRRGAVAVAGVGVAHRRPIVGGAAVSESRVEQAAVDRDRGAR